jgi:troponin T
MFKVDKGDKFGNIVQAKQEMGMTKDQQEEAKRNYLASLEKGSDIPNLSMSELKDRIKSLHQRICKLETDNYDMEKRHERQEYDVSRSIFVKCT